MESVNNIANSYKIKSISLFTKIILLSGYLISFNTFSNTKIDNRQPSLNWGWDSINTKTAHDNGYTGKNISIGLSSGFMMSSQKGLKDRLFFFDDKYNGTQPVKKHIIETLLQNGVYAEVLLEQLAQSANKASIIANSDIGIAPQANIYSQHFSNNLYSMIESTPVRVILHNSIFETDEYYQPTEIVTIPNIDNSPNSMKTLNYKKLPGKQLPNLFLSEVFGNIPIRNFIDSIDGKIKLSDGKNALVNIKDNKHYNMGLIHSWRASNRNNILNIFSTGDYNHYNEPGALAGMPLIYNELLPNTLAVSNIIPVRNTPLEISNDNDLFTTSDGTQYLKVQYHNKEYLREINVKAGEMDFLWELKNNQLHPTNILLNDKYTNKTLYVRSSQCGYTALWCVTAPGTRIYASNIGLAPDNSLVETYDYTSGTADAAAHVAGASAILMERFPYMSSSDISLVLKTTTTDIDENGVVENKPKVIDRYFGWGEINLEKAIKGPSMFVSSEDAKNLLSDDLKLELKDELENLARTFGNGDFIVNIGKGIKYDEGTPRERSCDSKECEYDKWENDISGSGGLIKKGSGTLELAGKNNTYLGDTHVQEGDFIVSGAITSQIYVTNNAVLSGHGQSGNVHVQQNSYFSPSYNNSNMTRTFTINGDVTFDKNTTFLAKIAPINNEIDKLVVTGKAYLNQANFELYNDTPNERISNKNIKQYLGKHYSFLTANQGIEGEFSNHYLDTLANDEMKPELIKSENETTYSLIFSRRNQQKASLTELNEKISFDHRVSSLKSYSSAINDKARDSSVIHSDIITEQLQNNRRFREQLAQRLKERSLFSEYDDVPATWGAILHSSSRSNHYHGRNYGVLIGGDKQLNSSTYGIVAGYLDNKLNYSNKSHGQNKSYFTGLYLENSSNNWKWLNGVTYSFNNLETQFIDKNDGVFNANYHAHAAQLFTSLSKQFDFGTFKIEPVGSLSYSHVWSDSLKQTNGTYHLNGDKTHMGVFNSSLGAVISKQWQLNNGISVTAHTGASWLHTYGGKQYGANFLYETNNPLISANTYKVKNPINMIEDSAQINAGILTQINQQTAISTSYSSLLSTKYQDHSANLAINWRF